MRLVYLIVMMVLASAASATDLWRWVDDQGVVHYSDRPVPGAEKIVIQGAQTFRAPAVPSSPASDPEDESGQGDGNVYRRFSIAQPGQEETLWNIEGRLDVQLQVDPPIRANHELRVYLDGQPVDNVPAAATSFTVGNVFRGEHTLRAAIVDGNGRELVSSAPVKFVVQQTSLLNPNNPNTSPPGVGPAPGRPGGG